jgi:hypothetical protein
MKTKTKKKEIPFIVDGVEEGGMSCLNKNFVYFRMYNDDCFESPDVILELYNEYFRGRKLKRKNCMKALAKTFLCGRQFEIENKVRR